MQQSTFDVETSIKSAELQQAAADTTSATPHPNDVPIDFVKLAQNPLYQTNEQKLLACSVQKLVVLTRIMEISQATLDLMTAVSQRDWSQCVEPQTQDAPASTTATVPPTNKGKPMFVGKPRR